MTETPPQNPALQARILLDRLERISADSAFAHQASGIRASLAKALSQGRAEDETFLYLLDLGFQILEDAAREIPGEDSIQGNLIDQE
jgi:hypothetical protein